MLMMGVSAFRNVCKRHGLEGLLQLGCFNNAIAEAYRAMVDVDRAENAPLYNWSA